MKIAAFINQHRNGRDMYTIINNFKYYCIGKRSKPGLHLIEIKGCCKEFGWFRIIKKMQSTEPKGATSWN